jgi:hypothetical protein
MTHSLSFYKLRDGSYSLPSLPAYPDPYELAAWKFLNFIHDHYPHLQDYITVEPSFSEDLVSYVKYLYITFSIKIASLHYEVTKCLNIYLLDMTRDYDTMLNCIVEEAYHEIISVYIHPDKTQAAS